MTRIRLTRADPIVISSGSSRAVGGGMGSGRTGRRGVVRGVRVLAAGGAAGAGRRGRVFGTEGAERAAGGADDQGLGQPRTGRRLPGCGHGCRVRAGRRVPQYRPGAIDGSAAERPVRLRRREVRRVHRRGALRLDSYRHAPDVRHRNRREQRRPDRGPRVSRTEIRWPVDRNVRQPAPLRRLPLAPDPRINLRNRIADGAAA